MILIPPAARLAALMLLLPPLAHGGRPLVTDDATVTTADACQLESWQHSAAGGRELWLLPACNLVGGVEITAGGVRLWREGAEDVSAYNMQAKTLLREIAPSGLGFDYGIGIGAGVLRGADGFDSDYAYLPLTLQFDEGALTVHVNAGWQHDRRDDSDAFTWGLGAQVLLLQNLSAFIETTGDDASAANAHAGLTVIAIPDRLHVDASYGRSLGTAPANSFLTFGINVYLPPF